MWKVEEELQRANLRKLSEIIISENFMGCTVLWLELDSINYLEVACFEQIKAKDRPSVSCISSDMPFAQIKDIQPCKLWIKLLNVIFLSTQM